MTGVDVEHTKALERAASEGPWEAYPNRKVKGIAHIRIPLAMHPTAWTADAEFIAHARTAVPALVAEVEALRARMAAAEVMIRDHLIGDDITTNSLGRSLLRALNPEAMETP